VRTNRTTLQRHIIKAPKYYFSKVPHKKNLKKVPTASCSPVKYHKVAKTKVH